MLAYAMSRQRIGTSLAYHLAGRIQYVDEILLISVCYGSVKQAFLVSNTTYITDTVTLPDSDPADIC